MNKFEQLKSTADTLTVKYFRTAGLIAGLSIFVNMALLLTRHDLKYAGGTAVALVVAFYSKDKFVSARERIYRN